MLVVFALLTKQELAETFGECLLLTFSKEGAKYLKKLMIR